VTTPAITYELLDPATNAHKRWLTQDDTQTGLSLVVGAEPVFTGALNVGVGQLQLQVDRYPGPSLGAPVVFPDSCGFAYFDLVKITLPDGTYMGTWKYEGYTADLRLANRWQINLMPLAAELSDVDYAANYTAADLPFQPHLGTTLMDVPVVAAVARTPHCTLLSHANDGNSYAVVYALQNGRVVDTLRQAVTLMGADWWWYCRGDGAVELHHGARTTVNIPRAHIAWMQHAFAVDKIINVLAIQGGFDPVGVPYSITRVVTAGAYGTTAIGRRVGQPLVDPTLGDLATITKHADQILARAQTPIDARTLRLVGVAILTPGDAVTLTDVDGPGVTSGPWYVTDTKLFGSTGVQEVTIATQ
jgi:hypothetical protein